jgi:hypothetical protein
MIESVSEEFDEMFTIKDLRSTAELVRYLATKNFIESPNLMVRRFSGRVANCRDFDMALRRIAAGFIEAENSFKKLRGYAELQTLINGLWPNAQPFTKAT